MKNKLQNCSKCNMETWHMIGKKQATTRSSAYTRRSTSECTKCGTREIINKKTGRRTINRHNDMSQENKEVNNVN